MAITTRRNLLAVTGLAAVTASIVPFRPAGAGEHDAPLTLSLPAPTGPHPVGRTDLHIRDDTRTDPWAPELPYRELMVTVWYPARRAFGFERARWMPRFIADTIEGSYPEIAPGAVDWAGLRGHARIDAPARRGRHPVLLYGPGHFQPRFMWTSLAEEMASRGYIVAAVDRTYETDVEFPDGIIEGRQPEGGLPDDPIPWLQKTIRVWSGDGSSTLDAIEMLADGGNPDVDGKPLPPQLCASVDASRVGTFGAAVGSGLGAMQLAFDEPRVSAVYSGDTGLSPSFVDDPEPIVSFAEEGLEQPMLIMRPTDEFANPDPFYDDFYTRSTGPKWELEPQDSRSLSQTDVQSLLPQVRDGLKLPDEAFTELIGEIDPVRSVRAQRAYASAFFDVWLKRRDNSLLDGPSADYPEIRFVRR